MKKLSAAIFTTTLLTAGSAQAATAIQGSDTLAGVMTDSIISGGLDSQIQYIGGALLKEKKGSFLALKLWLQCLGHSKTKLAQKQKAKTSISLSMWLA